ncbi:MAG: radical SAM protein [archaeon]
MRIGTYYAILKTIVNIYAPRLFGNPLILHIDITNRCNLKCRHCDVWKCRKKRDMPLKVFTELIGQAGRMGLKMVAISGGEPFLHPQLLQMISYLKQKGIFATISTNGTLLNSGNCRMLKTIGLDQLVISMEAAGDRYDEFRGIKGGYKGVLKAIGLARASGLNHAIGTCITKQNFRDLPGLAAELSRMQVPRMYLYPFYLSPRNIAGNKTDLLRFSHEDIEEYKLIVRRLVRYRMVDRISGYILIKSVDYFSGKGILLDDIPCYAPLFSCIIGFEGDVSPCWYSDKVLGNVYEDDFADIWNSGEFGIIRNKARKKICSKRPHCLTINREISARMHPGVQLRALFTKWP